MRLFQLLLIIVTFFTLSCSEQTDPRSLKPLVLAPFEGLDTLAVNDWWNRAENPIIRMDVPRDSVVAFGIYTVANNKLKLTAQLYPLYPNEDRKVRLEVDDDGWKEIAKADVNDLGWSATFEVEGWDHSKDTPYRILHGKKASFEGLIRKDPIDKDVISIAAMSCNSNKDRGLRENYVRNINHQDPDIVFFAGDQSYDHTEHTAAWLKFGLQFKELFRNRPCVTIPDDHDIGQGNLWGEGGIKAQNRSGDDGGYYYHHEYVKMVERCQTAHLPDPYDPTPIVQGIKVYYTNMIVGGVDFAIIEDRKFKSGPAGKIPQIGPRPDHIRDPSYDPKSVDVEGLTLLGDRQLTFLNNWAEEREGVQMKAVLSQTGFCGGAHIHGKKDNRLHADMDSNGWPQTGRNKALKAIQKANAVHIAGDQHLATIIKHGVEEFDDGPWAFVVPALVNNYYSRWWWPEDEKPGKNANDRLPWTGQYLDGFNNKITMHAYVNPESPSKGGGYGLTKFTKSKNEVTFECWPRDVDVTTGQAEQFTGWPFTVSLSN